LNFSPFFLYINCRRHDIIIFTTPPRVHSKDKIDFSPTGNAKTESCETNVSKFAFENNFNDLGRARRNSRGGDRCESAKTHENRRLVTRDVTREAVVSPTAAVWLFLRRPTKNTSHLRWGRKTPNYAEGFRCRLDFRGVELMWGESTFSFVTRLTRDVFRSDSNRATGARQRIRIRGARFILRARRFIDLDLV